MYKDETEVVPVEIRELFEYKVLSCGTQQLRQNTISTCQRHACIFWHYFLI